MNRPHVIVGADPVNIGLGLRSGRYIAQVNRHSDSVVLYASAVDAPDDSRDWFGAAPGAYFTFSASGSCPTWARTEYAVRVSDAMAASASLAIADFK